MANITTIFGILFILGLAFPGHTEALAHLSGVAPGQEALMLASDRLRIAHVTERMLRRRTWVRPATSRSKPSDSGAAVRLRRSTS